MNRNLAVTLVGIGAVLSASWAVAQEQTTPEQQNQTASKQWAKGAAEQQEQTPSQQQDQTAPPQQVADGGTEAVAEAQQENGVPIPERQEAEDVLRKLMEKKGWHDGWDPDKKRFIAVGMAELKCKDPAKDKNFQNNRRLLMKEAALNAKTDILRFLLMEMSAEDKIFSPETANLDAVIEKEAIQLRNDVERQKEVLAKLLEKKDRLDAEILHGTPFSKRLDDLMAAAIKKLDKEYNANKHDEAAAARYREAVENLKREKAHYDELVKKVNSQKGKILKTRKSVVELTAAMPIFGATVLLQTESWDKDGTYQVAVMMVWSNVLERAARSILTGENFSVKPKAENATVHKWLSKQDLSSMVGSRQYIDNKGNRWFLGVAAESVSRKLNPEFRNFNRRRALAMATQEAGYAVFSDAYSHEVAQEIMNVRSAGNDDETINQTAKTFAGNLSQKISKLKLRGGQPLLSKVVRHPITGDDIYVVVYGFNPANYGPALKAWERNYATKTQMLRHQTVERGRQAAVDDAVKAATNDPNDFKRGYNKQKKSLNRELQRRQQKKGGVRVYNNKGSNTKSAPAKSTSGTFGGDTDVSDDF